jgi:hypothetical protein
MTTKELEVKRSAKVKGDKVYVTSTSRAVDEQTIGGFREEYQRRDAQLKSSKNELKDLDKQLEGVNAKLKKEDMHLLQKLKPAVTLLMQKEFMDKKKKDLKRAVDLMKKELEGLTPIYKELTDKEMDNRKEGKPPELS